MISHYLISFTILSRIVISSEARNLFRLRGRLSGMADNGKPDISSMCVMEVVRTVKNAGRKNFEDLSSRVLLYEIGVAVSATVTGVSDLNTAFGHRPYICVAQPPPPSLIPSHQSLIPDSKKHPGNAFCLYSNAGGTRNRRRCGQMYQSTDVLAVVGARPRRGQGSVESMDFPDIFCLSYMFSLRQVGEKD